MDESSIELDSPSIVNFVYKIIILNLKLLFFLNKQIIHMPKRVQKELYLIQVVAKKLKYRAHSAPLQMGQSSLF